MKILIAIFLAILLAAAGALAFLYSGIFDTAADEPHGAFVHWLTETTRERSIAVRARGIEVPNLDDPKLILEGASEYSQMCVGCHLAPGMEDNEMRRGLYPPAPELAKQKYRDNAAAAARQFWIIKHGIKMSAMPAWGLTHDDATIWSIVSFVQKLDTLTPTQFAEMTQSSGSAHDHSGHWHARDSSD